MVYRAASTDALGPLPLTVQDRGVCCQGGGDRGCGGGDSAGVLPGLHRAGCQLVSLRAAGGGGCPRPPAPKAGAGVKLLHWSRVAPTADGYACGAGTAGPGVRQGERG